MYKIVHIARPVAGVGIYIDLIAKNINDQKFENYILCNSSEKGIEIRNRDEAEVPQLHINLLREINFLNDIKCFYNIIKLLKEIKPNIIHCHSAKAGFLGRLAGAYLKIPTIYTPHAFSYLSTEIKIKRNLYKTIEKLFKFLPSKLLACSRSEYNRAINDLNYKKSKLYIWNNSIGDIVELKPSKMLSSLPEEFICSIGRPSYQKNIEMLLEVILLVKKEIKDIHLVLLGIGNQSAILDDLNVFIKKNNLERNITMIRWVERIEAMSILQKSKMCISSSLYEGLPYSIIEALSLEKPCVVTKVDGNIDLIKNGYNGYLVELGDIQDMAEKIISIYLNKGLRKKMSINARKEFLDNYNIVENIVSLEEIYNCEIVESLR